MPSMFAKPMEIFQAKAFLWDVWILALFKSALAVLLEQLNQQEETCLKMEYIFTQWLKKKN